MSVWSTTAEVRVKKYESSHIDPRKKAGVDTVDFALVADYVFNDAGRGERVLPYLRMGVGSATVLLTVAQARRVRDELSDFISRSKTAT